MWRAHCSTNIPCLFVTLRFCTCFYSWKTPIHPSKHNSNVIAHWSFSHFPRQSYPIAPSSVSIPIPSYIAIHLFVQRLPSPWGQESHLNLSFQKKVSTHKCLWNEWIDHAQYRQCFLDHPPVSLLSNLSPTPPRQSFQKESSSAPFPLSKYKEA